MADETYFDVCSGIYSVSNSTVTSNAICFIQVFSEATTLTKKSSNVSIGFITYDYNSTIGSTVIFGGLLDQCVPDPRTC